VVKRLEIDVRRGAGRPGVLAAFVIVSLLVTTLWYREGTGGPLHVTRRAVLAASEPFAVAGGALTSPFRAAANWASGSTVDRTQYEDLKKQNIELKQRLAELQEAKAENARLRALVEFANAQDYPTVGARIIGRPTDSWGGSVVIDRGTTKGVKPGNPVVAAGGLVGQVIDVTPWNARVRLITDSNSGVSVLVQRTRANGVVRGSLDGKLRLDFVDKAKMPVRGDVLVTSGLGGVYPKGIVVGEVTDVSSQQADLYPEVAVASRVDIGRIEEVVVLVGAPSATQPGGVE
jgi:rod shape-determining protein MreC